MRCLIKYQFISHTPPPHPSFSYPLYFISSLRILIHLLSQRFTSDIYYPDVDIRASSIRCFRLSVCPSVWQRTNVLLLLSVRPSICLQMMGRDSLQIFSQSSSSSSLSFRRSFVSLYMVIVAMVVSFFYCTCTTIPDAGFGQQCGGMYGGAEADCIVGLIVVSIIVQGFCHCHSSRGYNLDPGEGRVWARDLLPFYSLFINHIL